MSQQPFAAIDSSNNLPAVVRERLASNLADPAAVEGAALAGAFAPILPALHGVRYTAYGHSFGQVQASIGAWAGSVYPARLRDLIHADPALYANRTVNGASTTDIATTAASTWVDGDGGLVTWMGGQNSIGSGQSESDFKAQLRAFLGTMRGATGYPPTVLVFLDTLNTETGYARFSTVANRNDAAIHRYNGYISEVVAEFEAEGWVLLADPIGAGWDAQVMTEPDGQHPNDIGHACIASAALRALSGAPFRRGLNRGVRIAPSPGELIAADTFTRANSSTTLGSTEVGAKSYVAADPQGDTPVFGIENNQAYRVSKGIDNESYATFDAGVSDMDVSVRLTWQEGQARGAGPIARFVDPGNMLIVDCVTTGQISLYKKVDNIFVSLGAVPANVQPNGDVVVRLYCKGSTVKVFVDGVEMLSVVETAHQSATRAGIRIAANADPAQISVDDLAVRAA